MTSQPIQFSSINSSQARGAVRVETADKWVLADQSVYYLSAKQYENKWSLPGQPLSHSVIDDTFWIGTTAGTERYRVGEPSVGVEFFDAPPSGPHNRENIQHPAIDQISVAFGAVLLSGQKGVYRFAEKESRKEAFRTALPPGRAYGVNPYWWVTKTDVYLLPQDLKVGAPVLHQEPTDDPIVAGGYLWFTSKAGTLFVISESGAIQAMDKISPAVTTVGALSSDDGQNLVGDVWVATVQGLWSVQVSPGKPGGLSAPHEELPGGEIRKVLVMKDRVFYSMCTQRDSCYPSVWEGPITNGALNRGQVRLVATGASAIWLLNSSGDTLYVPTQEKLVSYSLAKRTSESTYDYSTRFVGTWGQHLLLGSALQLQQPAPSTPASSASMKDTSTLGTTDLFANLCRFEPAVKLSGSFQGAELFDWYTEPFGTRILIGSNAKASPLVKPLTELAKGSLQICAEPCKKDEDWKEELPLATVSGWIASTSFDYRIRNRMTQDDVPWRGRVVVISQQAFWGFWGLVLFVTASSALVFLAGKASRFSEICRKILFHILPDSGWPAWINLPVQLATSFDIGLAWFVRPILLQFSKGAVVRTKADEDIVAELYKDGTDDTPLVLYECLQDESSERAASICKIVSAESLDLKRPWRLPIIVRLQDLPDGDTKKALSQRLQMLSLNNATLADRLVRSRRLLYVFLGAEELKDKIPISPVLQAARGQECHSVVITPTPPAWSSSSVSKTIQSLQTEASKFAGGGYS